MRGGAARHLQRATTRTLGQSARFPLLRPSRPNTRCSWRVLPLTEKIDNAKLAWAWSVGCLGSFSCSLQLAALALWVYVIRMDVWRPRWMVLLLLPVAGQWSRLWCYLSAAAEHHAASHVEFAKNRCGRRSSGYRIIRESWHQQPFRFLHG